jgi:hypothetical protein
MEDSRKRLLERFRQAGDVVPLGAPKRPKGPVLSIHGRKYVLSDWWAHGASVEDMANPDAGGARLIDTGGNRYRYLWVFDTERKVIAMWRHSDGDEKYNSRESSSMQEIYTLEKKGQLNRVTHDEYLQVEREMQRRADEALKSLKQWAQENQSDLEKQAGEILDAWFKRNVQPSLERRITDLDRGVKPLGYKYRPESPRSDRTQAVHFLLGKALDGFTQDQAYRVVEKVVGYDPYDPPEGVDPQSVQWAYGDFIERVYEQFGG